MQIETMSAGVLEKTLGNKPKVSVCVVTYNQEQYIRQCLQSIVDQITDFDFEIIVGDDGSTDDTQRIVHEFSANHPELFRLLFHPKNIGAAFNYARTHEVAAGEYVAHIDGDDLMLPNKLQRQVDAFEANSGCIMVTHDMHIINGDGSINKRTFKKHKAGINTLWDLYNVLPFFAHSSKMVKRDVELNVLPLIENNTLDIELHVMMAERGNIFHIDEPLGQYRTGIGVSSASKKSVNPILVEGAQRIFERAIKKHPKQVGLLKKIYSQKLLEYAYQAALLKNREQVKKFSRQSVGICVSSINQLLFVFLPLVFVFALVGVRNSIRYGKKYDN